MTDYIVQEKKLNEQGQEQGNAFPITLTTAVFDGATKERLDVTLDKKANKSDIPSSVVVDQTLDESSEHAISNKAVTTKIKEVESKIPTDTVTTEQLNAVRSTAESKTTMQEVEQKGYLNESDVNQLIGEKGYQTAQEVESTITSKDYATNTRVNEVDAKIPTDTVTTEQLNAVKSTAESKTTMQEVEAKGYQTDAQVKATIKTNPEGFAKSSEIPPEVVVDTELSDSSTNPLQNKVVTEKLNILKQEVDSKTTIGEVEAKGYQTDAQVKATIKTNPEGFAKTEEIPTSTSQLTNDSGYAKMWFGTQEEYDAITTKESTTVYNIVEKQA